MRDLASSSLILLGLQGSGKTNFIVGLDVVLDAQMEGDGLVHHGLASDRAYLQRVQFLSATA
jgi:signal recognition particle GTPase